MPKSDTAGDTPRRGRLLVISLFVFAAYAVVGTATLTLGQVTGLASPVWPAAGLAFAAAYVWGWRVAPAIALGSVFANSVTLLRQDVLSSEAIVVAVVIGIGAAVQGVFGAFLVTQFVGRRASLSNARQIVSFLLLGGPVAAVISATVATGAQVIFDLVSFDQVLPLWLTWWVGDSIGVVIFAPLVLMLIPNQASVWHRRRLKVAIPTLVGVGLFVTLFVQVDSQAMDERNLRLEQLAASAAGTLERDVARHQEALEGLSSFFEASEVVDGDEFRTYTYDVLDRLPNLQAMSWNPLLAEDELRDFEEFQRDIQGVTDFQVTERNDDGELIPVSVRDEYVPVGYIEPLADNKAALGFDINSNPTRKEAIDRARNEGVPSATAPIDLVQDADSQKGMLALVPIREGDGVQADGSQTAGEISGFAVGVYRIRDLLVDSFDSSEWDRIDVLLNDVTDSARVEEIAYRPAKTPPTIDRTTAERGLEASDTFDVYGRTWQIGVVPTSGPLAASNRRLPPSLTILGLVVLTLLQAFVLLVTGLERDARRQASKATREANTDSLTGLQNRRAFLENLQRVRDRSISEGTPGVLLYFDLDKFKRVNDEGGHVVGDQLLRQVAIAVSGLVRSRDIVARLGGDEFAVILNDCPLDQGIEIADELASVVRSVEVSGPRGSLTVGVSIGLTEIDPHDGLGIDALIRRADDASYEAKRSGGGVRVASREWESGS